MPQDFDRVLRQMKDDLALTELRRSLLDPSLNAREILALARQIERIQNHAPA